MGNAFNTTVNNNAIAHVNIFNGDFIGVYGDNRDFTRAEAQETCHGLWKGDLAKILNSDENRAARDAVLDAGAKDGPTYSWIGLIDVSDDSSRIWEWEDGSLLGGGYSNWQDGQPNAINDDCGAFVRYGGIVGTAPKWCDRPCESDGVKSFVCRSSSNTPDFTVKSIDSSDKYIGVFNYLGLNYNDAELYCQNEYGTHLASIHSQSDHDLVMDAINGLNYRPMSNEEKYAWIGINDRDNEGTRVWTDGTAVDYVYWTNGYPTNSDNNRDCGYVTGPNSYFGTKWQDTSCSSRLQMFVCNKYKYDDLSCITVSKYDNSEYNYESEIGCPSNKVLTSCSGWSSGNLRIEDIDYNNGKCKVRSESQYFYAYARCCDINTYPSLTSYHYEKNDVNPNNDERVTKYCGDLPYETIVGCFGDYDEQDGFYVGNSDDKYSQTLSPTYDKCNGIGGQNTNMNNMDVNAICIEPDTDNNGKYFECKHIWGPESGTYDGATSKVKCPHNYHMTSCSSYSPWGACHTKGNRFTNINGYTYCQVKKYDAGTQCSNGGHGIWAQAICCKQYTDVTFALQ